MGMRYAKGSAVPREWFDRTPSDLDVEMHFVCDVEADVAADRIFLYLNLPASQVPQPPFRTSYTRRAGETPRVTPNRPIHVQYRNPDGPDLLNTVPLPCEALAPEEP